MLSPVGRYVIKARDGSYLGVKTEYSNAPNSYSATTTFIWTSDLEGADLFTGDSGNKYVNQLPPNSVELVQVERFEV